MKRLPKPAVRRVVLPLDVARLARVTGGVIPTTVETGDLTITFGSGPSGKVED